jgi:hypothetical protein
MRTCQEIAMSCPVCFGGGDDGVRESLNAGIGVLLGVTVIVLGLFARFFVKLARLSKGGRSSFFESPIARPTEK